MSSNTEIFNFLIFSHYLYVSLSPFQSLSLSHSIAPLLPNAPPLGGIIGRDVGHKDVARAHASILLLALVRAALARIAHIDLHAARGHDGAERLAHILDGAAGQAACGGERCGRLNKRGVQRARALNRRVVLVAVMGQGEKERGRDRQR